MDPQQLQNMMLMQALAQQQTQMSPAPNPGVQSGGLGNSDAMMGALMQAPPMVPPPSSPY